MEGPGYQLYTAAVFGLYIRSPYIGNTRVSAIYGRSIWTIYQKLIYRPRGLYLYTCPRVSKNHDETMILFNLSTPKLKVPTNSIVHWTNVKPTSLMALISILPGQIKANHYCHSLHALVPL